MTPESVCTCPNVSVVGRTLADQMARGMEPCPRHKWRHLGCTGCSEEWFREDCPMHRSEATAQFEALNGARDV